MPAISVTLIQGYSDSVKQTMASRLTDAVASTIAADPAGITVMLHEVSASGYMRGGRRFAAPGAAAGANGTGARAGAPRADGALLVERFLQAMQQRDLASARAALHADFEMRFPGNARMRTLEQLIEWSKPRYRSIGKKFDAIEPCWIGGRSIVWVYGSLFGEWPDGKPFEDIAFVDRFELKDDLLWRQTVWNDLAEYGPHAS